MKIIKFIGVLNQNNYFQVVYLVFTQKQKNYLFGLDDLIYIETKMIVIIVVVIAG